jgi:hypothetical protein
VTNPKLTLEWDASEGANRYEVQIDTDPLFSLPPIDAGKKTKYTPPTSLAQATYYWRVRAIDKAGNVSSWSDGQIFHLVAGNTVVTPPPAAPPVLITPVPSQPAPPHKPDDAPPTPEPPVMQTPPPEGPPQPGEPPDAPPTRGRSNQ